jgi:hypothetical protein
MITARLRGFSERQRREFDLEAQAVVEVFRRRMPPDSAVITLAMAIAELSQWAPLSAQFATKIIAAALRIGALKRQCRQCGKTYFPEKRSNSIWCSNACRQQAYRDRKAAHDHRTT